MDPTTFIALVLACAPNVHATTAKALVSVESGFNPHAIGVVGGALVRQPRRRAEAIATAQALQAQGWSFSVGLGQINSANFARLGLTPESAFEPCTNLAAMQSVLSECYARAIGGAREQRALRRALSCYYSGNFSTGLRDGYVARVMAAAQPPSRTSATACHRPDVGQGVIAMAHSFRTSTAARLIAAASLTALTLLPRIAAAQGFDKINTTVTNVNAILVTISVAVVTIAIIWAGFKMIFQGARLVDVANVLIGGTLIGGAAAFANYIVS